MASEKRIQQVVSLLQEEVSILVKRELPLGKDVLVTIVGAEVSPDLLYATLRVSVFPPESAREVFETVTARIWNIQQELNRRLRMRPVPKIRFVRDGASQTAARVEKLIERLDRP
ncbi:MAG: 30S ribosome-binding factor RbfA [bacterium]|nr:30S ribosome-binding factor RbfA [bacterium]MDZ4296571.1 30S ribosome-binding factor RbfA [Patescibacteria group bacterium]